MSRREHAPGSRRDPWLHAWSCLLLAACEGRSLAARAPVAPSACLRARDARSALGSPAWDALASLSHAPGRSVDSVDAPGGPPRALFETDAFLLSRDDALLAAVERAADASPPAAPLPARVVLQNDLFGLWQRLAALPRAAPPASQRTRLQRAAARAVLRLAVPSTVAVAANVVPEALRRTLPPGSGWRAQGTELASLSHERLFGNRRLFRLFVREGPPRARALASQLVAVDADGRVLLTGVVGEIELRGDSAIDGGDSPEASRVWELHRTALACGDDGLRELEEVQTVPGLGANGFLLRVGRPVALRERPCARCHTAAHDAPMSLPREDERPEARWAPILRALQADADRLRADATR